MSARLNEILDPKLVVLELREQTAAEAILEIVQNLRDNGLVEDFYKLADAVMEREGRTSTNTGGIAASETIIAPRTDSSASRFWGGTCVSVVIFSGESGASMAPN